MIKILSFGSLKSKHNKFLNDCSETLSKREKYLTHRQKVILKSGGAVKLVCTRVLSQCTVKILFTTNPALK